MPIFASRRFYFLRHGETDANVAGVVSGQTDSPLTDHGRAQARAVRDHARTLAISDIVASPLSRARETAAIVAAGTGHEVALIPGLRERNWGIFEGRPIDQRPPPTTTPLGGEPWESFVARTQAALGADFGANLQGDCTLVVAHSGTYRALTQILGLPFATQRPPNAALIAFERIGKSWQSWIVGGG